MRSILTPEPNPVPAEGDVWREIIDALDADDPIRPLAIERRQQGIDRYGVPLQRGNGRNHLNDAVQEALDLLVYERAAYIDWRPAAAEVRRLLRGGR